MTTRPPNANYLAPASVVSDQVHRGRSLFRAAAESFEELLESRRILSYHTTINPLVESVNDGSVRTKDPNGSPRYRPSVALVGKDERRC